jgi:hypothetical protein
MQQSGFGKCRYRDRDAKWQGSLRSGRGLGMPPLSNPRAQEH